MLHRRDVELIYTGDHQGPASDVISPGIPYIESGVRTGEVVWVGDLTLVVRMDPWWRRLWKRIRG